MHYIVGCCLSSPHSLLVIVLQSLARILSLCEAVLSGPIVCGQLVFLVHH